MIGNVELISRLVLAAVLGSAIGFERGSMTFHSLQDALGPASPRIKQFVMQQSDDDPQFDEVPITLNRVSATEYTAICGQLKAPPGVKEFRENGEPA
ncbi:hypothetical protein BN2476_30023 [Paraburkholderia piptadeniae]|uniref:Uncharacterized protein n=1 Tax=Paraburkholderia piptadeniae TaxID=1701573 RepID=A0A1N7RJU7_9BURK|nr:hypothetical protein [Paraburkholderia piptadeniae]SIT35381.1 hypothetical protein BN2476_30023 [Paraburkholderia piptadeniae]